MIIYKILNLDEWKQFQQQKTFSGTELDQEDGFFHFSTKEQVKVVLEKYFKNTPTVILEFNSAPYENVFQWDVISTGEKYPHLYCKKIQLKDVGAVLDPKEFL